MQEYLDNGLQLGWLIVPKTQKVEIYRRDRTVECLQSPRTLSGEDILPGLLVDLQPIWQL
jgi:Uma2 family endonuclease